MQMFVTSKGEVLDFLAIQFEIGHTCNFNLEKTLLKWQRAGQVLL